MIEIYTAISELIKEKFSACAYIDLYNNQIRKMHKQEAFPLPAVFISFQSIEWDDTQLQSYKKGLVKIRIYLAQLLYKETSSRSSEQEEALKILKNVKILEDMLSEFGVEDVFSPLLLERTNPDEDWDKVTMYSIDFSTVYSVCNDKKESCR